MKGLIFMMLSNNKMKGYYYINSIKQFSKTLYKPYNIILALLIIFGYGYFNQVKILKTVHQVLFLTVFGFSVLQFIINFTILKKKRYLYLEKTSKPNQETKSVSRTYEANVKTLSPA